MNIEEEKKKVQSELTRLQQQQAVYENRISELSEQLGVEPDLQKISEAIKAAEEEEKRISSRVDDLINTYNKITQ